MKNSRSVAVIQNLFLALLLLTGVYSCHQSESILQPIDDVSISTEGITVAEALSWYRANMTMNAGSRVGTKEVFRKNPIWHEAVQQKFKGADAVIVPFEVSNDSPIPLLRNDTKSRTNESLSESQREYTVDLLSNLLIYKTHGKTIAEIVTMLPDESFYKLKSKKNWKFDGLILVSDTNDEILRGYHFKNGKFQNTVSLDRPTNPKGRVKDMYACGSVDWYSQVCIGASCELHWDRVQTLYCDNSGGTPEMGVAIDYLISSGGGGGGAQDYGSYTYVPAFVFPGLTDPVVDISTFIKCFLNGSDDYKYEITIYVDQPKANSSSSMFVTSGGPNVGHTFIGFRKIDIVSGYTVERTFGLYPGDQMSAMAGTTGYVHDNASHEYEVSVTYPVSKGQMNSAFNTATNSAAVYDLDDYNCTDYAKSICDAAGLYLPTRNGKIRIDNSTFFIRSPGRLGQELRSLQSQPGWSNMIKSYSSAQNAQGYKGDC